MKKYLIEELENNTFRGLFDNISDFVEDYIIYLNNEESKFNLIFDKFSFAIDELTISIIDTNNDKKFDVKFNIKLVESNKIY